jgi:hypothetical protein
VVDAPFVINDGSGQALFRVDSTGTFVRARLSVDGPQTPTVVVGNTSRGSVTLGVGASATGFVVTRSATGADAIALGAYRSNPVGLYVLGPDGATPRASVTADGRVFAGDEGKGAFYGGVGSSGHGFVVTQWSNGVDAVRLGTTDGNPLAISVVDSARKVQASLGLDARGQGLLRVGSTDGARTVAGIVDGGASLALYNGPGSQYRIGLFGSQSSNFVHLRGEDRSLRLDTDLTGSSLHVGAAKRSVQLNVSSEGGAVHVFNAAGNAVSSLTENPSGRGRLSLGDAAGQTVVEAGSTADGLGVVRAGPVMGGPTMIPGMPPFAILGRRK